MRTGALALLAAAALGAPAHAQHAGHGHAPPPPVAADPHAGHQGHEAAPATPPASPDPHAGHAMPAQAPPGVAAPAPVAPVAPTAAPVPPTDHAADAVWGADAMRASRQALTTEHGGGRYFMALFNLLERQVGEGRDGVRWDGEAWYGGDIHRLVLRTEGRADDRRGAEEAELQAVYSRAVGPYLNLQAGARRTFAPRGRTDLSLGVEGLAPGFFDLEATLFLTEHGDVLGRVEGWTDLRLTQRLILQPRVELNAAASDSRADRFDAGLVDAELGLRLRYEWRREFAPYVGLSWERRFGDAARDDRAEGASPDQVRFVVGVRAWY